MNQIEEQRLREIKQWRDTQKDPDAQTAFFLRVIDDLMVLLEPSDPQLQKRVIIKMGYDRLLLRVDITASEVAALLRAVDGCVEISWDNYIKDKMADLELVTISEDEIKLEHHRNLTPDDPSTAPYIALSSPESDEQKLPEEPTVCPWCQDKVEPGAGYEGEGNKDRFCNYQHYKAFIAQQITPVNEP